VESRATAVVRFGAPIAVRALRRMTKQMPPFRHVPTCRRAARMIAISSRKIRREKMLVGRANRYRDWPSRSAQTPSSSLAAA